MGCLGSHPSPFLAAPRCSISHVSGEVRTTSFDSRIVLEGTIDEHHQVRRPANELRQGLNLARRYDLCAISWPSAAHERPRIKEAVRRVVRRRSCSKQHPRVERTQDRLFGIIVDIYVNAVGGWLIGHIFLARSTLGRPLRPACEDACRPAGARRTAGINRLPVLYPNSITSSSPHLRTAPRCSLAPAPDMVARCSVDRKVSGNTPSCTTLVQSGAAGFFSERLMPRTTQKPKRKIRRPMVRLSVTLPQDVHDALEKAAARRDVSLAWTLRQAAERYLRRQGSGATGPRRSVKPSAGRP